uniref:Epidermal cell surface receptor n=1 Tax=Cacopsylla melanoneura TaxID=428564 RepID=A0A8D8TQM0_9HEMI
MFYSNLFNGYIFVSLLVYNLGNFVCCRPNIQETNELSPGEGCTYQNKTYPLGESFDVECDKKCKCGLDGVVYCEQRCPLFTVYDSSIALGRCLEIRNPLDECCVLNVCGSNRSMSGQTGFECVYSEWSPWTACTAPCGKDAFKLRTRTLLNANSMSLADMAKCNDRLETVKCSLLPCKMGTGAGKKKT